jgi:putative hemolysin
MLEIVMDVLLIVLLTLLNGVFAMSEMALASSRKARLSALAEMGDSGARAALRLLDQPTQFLSTVQIGITSIGVLNGIVGEAAFSDDLAHWLLVQGVGEQVAEGLATALVVTAITFSTILFGELVPKRVGQLFPETVARAVAPLMLALATLTKPFV